MEQAAVMLQNLFHTPVRYETYIFHLSASIGASIYPWDSGDVDTLIQYADTAMYSVKHSGCKDGYRFFDESLIHLLSVRHAVNQKLKSAEPEKDFMLYYQPQVNAQTGEIIGMEAFPHLKGDLEKISPADLIPVAEETGFMSRLGIWIVSSALRQVVKWNKKYGMDMHLTVNLSPLQLIDSDYFDALHDLMESLQLSPSILTLDVANSVIMGAASSAKESMKALHDRGYYLSLNDFGGDDINLSYVLSCGFHGIKLSRSLVSGMKADPNVQILLDTILAIAKNMNIVVTAVGIEMEEEADRMKELGIVEMQGYLFGKPEKAEAMEKKLRRASNGKRTR